MQITLTNEQIQEIGIQPPPDYGLREGSNVARCNKITLIRFMRQVSYDISTGILKLRYDQHTPAVSLADSKLYVERYFKI